MDWGEATCLNAVFMPESFPVLREYQEIDLNARKLISSSGKRRNFR
jgi:hypothetical protein